MPFVTGLGQGIPDPRRLLAPPRVLIEEGMEAGFKGIAVALLGATHPLGIVPAALFNLLAAGLTKLLLSLVFGSSANSERIERRSPVSPTGA